MSDFLQFVLNYLRQALVLVIPALVIAAAVLAVTAKCYHKKYNGTRRFPWRKAVLILLLVGYLLVVFYVTVIRAGRYGGHYVNTHLFRAWREAWNSFSEKNWLNLMLNIAMFVPLGIMLPLLHARFKKWYIALPTGFGVSLVIELVQYIWGRGLFDVDDLLTNTLGAAIGFWLAMAAGAALGKGIKQCLCHSAALLAVAGSIGGIFLAYEFQEFGNLPDAPAFRVNTGSTAWTYVCDLSEAEQTVALYRMIPPSREECEAFGVEFLKQTGVSQVDVTHYNEEVYLRSGNRMMEVWYLDGSFDYWDLEDFDHTHDDYGRTDEQTIREMLLEFHIEVPENAVFSRDEDDWHCFTTARYMDGSAMVDGTLRCRYEDGYGIREIENRLTDFTYYGQVQIISPKQAAEQVCSGWVTSGDWFESSKPRQVEILSCDLSYQVDTKGFYQPVYLITVNSTDTNYEETILIPAIQ